MQPTHRAAVIEAFNTKPEITVFLISLKVSCCARLR
jgi:SNF2 family DNA or RNA helicase